MLKRTLLVPVDGTAFSRQILPEIQKLFPPEHYRVALLHVATPPEAVAGDLALPATYVDAALYLPSVESATTRHPIYDAEGLDSYRRGLEQRLDDDARPLRAGGYEAEMTVVFGRPVAAILEAIQAHAVDLVVMGTHDRGPVARFFVGSVTQEIQKHAAVPVLIIKLAERLSAAEEQDDAEAGEEVSPAPYGRATLGGLEGEGVVTVLRSANGRVVEVGGSWRQPGRSGTTPFTEGERVTYDGPVEEARTGARGGPPGDRTQGSRRARLRATIGHTTTLTPEGSDPVRLVNFTVDIGSFEGATEMEDDDGLASDQHELGAVPGGLSQDLRTRHRR